MTKQANFPAHDLDLLLADLTTTNARLGIENDQLREEVAMWKDRYESLLRDAQASEAAFDKAMQHGGL